MPEDISRRELLIGGLGAAALAAIAGNSISGNLGSPTIGSLVEGLKERNHDRWVTAFEQVRTFASYSIVEALDLERISENVLYSAGKFGDYFLSVGLATDNLGEGYVKTLRAFTTQDQQRFRLGAPQAGLSITDPGRQILDSYDFNTRGEDVLNFNPETRQVGYGENGPSESVTRETTLRVHHHANTLLNQAARKLGTEPLRTLDDSLELPFNTLTRESIEGMWVSPGEKQILYSLLRPR